MKGNDEDHLHLHPQQNHRHQQLPFYQRRFWKLSGNYLRNQKHTAYVILLLLTYAFGYFTSSKQICCTTPAVSDSVKTVNVIPPATSSPVLDSSNSYHNRFGSKCANPIPPELTRFMILDRIFNGTSPYENFPPAHVTHLLRPVRVKGWGSYGAVFENLIRKVRPRIIIEVGTFLGASATHMAELTRKLGLQTQILCIDDFRGWPGFRSKIDYVPIQNGDVMLLPQFLQNVIYFNSTESILPIPFSTGSTLRALCEWGIFGDLIEVDAGHDFQSAWMDINLAHKLLRPGGVLFGHDYFNRFDNKGVRRAVDLFAKIHGFKVSVDGQHWVME
ncbi:unnamed protein product [Amaranthus hypochondriacus]